VNDVKNIRTARIIWFYIQ